MQDARDPTRARLSGIVPDELNRPATGITVTATPPGAVFGVVPTTQTDASGAFALAGLLPPGDTRIDAFKESAFLFQKLPTSAMGAVET